MSPAGATEPPSGPERPIPTIAALKGATATVATSGAWKRVLFKQGGADFATFYVQSSSVYFLDDVTLLEKIHVPFLNETPADVRGLVETAAKTVSSASSDDALPPAGLAVKHGTWPHFAEEGFGARTLTPGSTIDFVIHDGSRVELVRDRHALTFVTLAQDGCTACDSQETNIATIAPRIAKAGGRVFVIVIGRGTETDALRATFKRVPVTVVADFHNSLLYGLGVTNVPRTYVVDRAGAVVNVMSGSLDSLPLLQAFLKMSGV